MIMSALISECRREYGDQPKSVSVARAGNGNVNLFNVGKFPVVEGSYQVYLSANLKTETTDYTYDLDNGDIRMVTTPANGLEVRSDHKYAFYRDKNWTEAINQGIDYLNAHGFFRDVVRSSTVRISANVQVYSAPSACIDIYQFLVSNNHASGGVYIRPYVNWRYSQDSNKLILGQKPTTANFAQLSYLRNLQKYAATSATVDVLDDWKEIIKKKAGQIFYRSMAGKIAKQGNATIDEGHFSFTNLRTMANDLQAEVEQLVKSKKPSRPSKDLSFGIDTGGVA